MPETPTAAPTLQPPPEGIFRTFEDLLSSVQRWAKDHGYGIVKLRASNYRDGKPTRYDLVCDRGGVKYNSTAKKRTPSTRKENTPIAQSIRSFTNKLDRLTHDVSQGFMHIGQRLDNIEKQLMDLRGHMGAYEPRFQGLESRMQAVEARGDIQLGPMDDVDVDTRILASM
ncbi:unnamed protein product [Parascedosporium putredinis]|uniref:Uncharacterized protein n=1 Tax=Parascedosporium putredinis TaxID=1442378 RepID=A0A9P1HAJ9_9PEZI|nr:unnamed protein product [Parascedosporium putredinis]CAI8002978.1 unnamed protein product [Parascedosporium putredinis]